MTAKIDFVVTWVDGNDIEWQKEKEHWQDKKEDVLNTSDRFRDWEFMPYWFRAIEKNTPWVNKIFFITQGHIPDWLDTKHPKLSIVRHSDYIPNEYLPTFNSNVIELNLHRIKELSENFVLFNDDMFVNKKMGETAFFENNLPKDIGVLSPLVPSRGTITSIVLNNVEIINDYFESRELIKNNFFKMFNLKYGKHIIKNICILPWKNILGFYDSHIPISYKKSIFNKVWEKEPEILYATSANKFRTREDVNHWLMRYWQICEGNFVPKWEKSGKYYNISDKLDNIVQDILFEKHGLICLNDGKIKDFQKSKQTILNAFQTRYPEKSSFEK